MMKPPALSLRTLNPYTYGKFRLEWRIRPRRRRCAGKVDRSDLSRLNNGFNDQNAEGFGVLYTMTTMSNFKEQSTNYSGLHAMAARFRAQASGAQSSDFLGTVKGSIRLVWEDLA